MNKQLLLAGISVAVMALCAAPLRARSAEQITVIEHVTVVAMTTDNAVLRDATVVIRDERIASLSGPAPAGARHIDGRSKWLIPGLSDMHVHVPTDTYLEPKRYPTQEPSLVFDTQDIMTPYLANGVTQILNLDAKVASFAQRTQVERGEALGPHMALAALINGGSSAGWSANSPVEGRQAVRDARAEGYEFIKVYSALNVDTFAAIVDEARKLGLKVVGHIPNAFQGQLASAFVPGYDMVAHAEEFSKHSKEFTDEDARQFAALAKQNGTWLSPTLTTMRWIASETRALDELRNLPSLQYVHPLLQSKWLTANQYNRNATPERIVRFERMVDFHARLVRAFKDAGVPIVAGTDAMTSGVVPGFSLHDELELLTGAGLTPAEALAAATRLPAVWLGVDVDRGTVETGKRADLVLLDADPLQDIANTRRIAGVFVNGRWTDRRKLDAMLADLAKRNTADKTRFDWNTATSR